VAEVERALGDDGRVVVRSSGTEPLVRVMVEAPTGEAAGRAAERLVVAVLAGLGSPAE
jgi:phosphoglucosamine mutase